jgi:hypothetical protein
VPFIVVIFSSVSDEFYLLTRTGHSFIDVAKESTPKASIASKVSAMQQIFEDEDDKPPFTSSLNIFPEAPEAESKEEHCVWDLLPELTITSPYVHSRADSNTFTTGNQMPEST